MKNRLTYRRALKYIYSLTDYEQRGLAAYAPEFYSLDRVRHLLSLLGDPHTAFKVVHVAGTKGKGSTSALIASGLRAAGYHTGLFTKPHLHTFRERLRVNGALVSEADVVRLLEEIRPLVSQVDGITTFEVMVVLALSWFAEQGVDWTVLEVGLGGRLDATNVVTPAVSVITSISFDHTAILGDTLAEIATEKAGIIKPGVAVVSAPQADEALAVIEETCRLKDAPLTLVGRDWTWKAGPASLAGQAFTLQRDQVVIPDLWVPLLGHFQLENAATAAATLSILRAAGGIVPEEAMRTGFRSVQWPGRLEILNRRPWVVADSAHNGYSAQQLVLALRANLDFERLFVIWGASTDHATPELIKALLASADRAIATQTHHPRAADPTWLQSHAAEMGFHLELSGSVAEALDLALRDANPEDLICCTGSVFVAAEARATWFARQGMPAPPSDPI